MFHELQSLLVLAHRLIESVGSLLSTTVRTIINTMVEPAPWSSPWDSVRERLHSGALQCRRVGRRFVRRLPAAGAIFAQC